MDYDRSYFAKRALEEHQASLDALGGEVSRSHAELAAAYALLSGITLPLSNDLYDDPAEAGESGQSLPANLPAERQPTIKGDPAR